MIDFKGASNGDCFFESTLEIEGANESIALYRPEILVQDLVSDQLYKKVADASLRISATSSTQVGSYDFTHTMEDKIRGVKKSIKFSVEIIASEKTSSLTGGGGSSGASDDSTASSKTSSGNSTDSGNSTSSQSEDGSTSSSTSAANETAS